MSAGGGGGNGGSGGGPASPPPMISASSSSFSASSSQPLRKNRVDADPVIFVSPPTKNNVYRDARTHTGFSLRRFYYYRSLSTCTFYQLVQGDTAP